MKLKLPLTRLRSFRVSRLLPNQDRQLIRVNNERAARKWPGKERRLDATLDRRQGQIGKANFNLPLGQLDGPRRSRLQVLFSPINQSGIRLVESVDQEHLPGLTHVKRRGQIPNQQSQYNQGSDEFRNAGPPPAFLISNLLRFAQNGRLHFLARRLITLGALPLFLVLL